MNKGGLPKRKPLPHFSGIERHNEAIIHFITVCTRDRLRILDSESVHQLLLEAWAKADAFMVGRYVIMPDHVHLFCSPAQPMPGYLETWIRFWKTFVSNRWSNQKKGKLWQRDFWDTQMRHGESYGNKWDYVRLNPVRHGLVKDNDEWPYQGEMHILDWHD